MSVPFPLYIVTLSCPAKYLRAELGIPKGQRLPRGARATWEVTSYGTQGPEVTGRICRTAAILSGRYGDFDEIAVESVREATEAERAEDEAARERLGRPR